MSVKFTFTTNRGQSAAKVYNCVIVDGQEIPAKPGSHFGCLVMAAAELSEGFTLSQLAAEAVNQGLKIEKEGAKSTPESLAKYYAKKLKQFNVIAEA